MSKSLDRSILNAPRDFRIRGEEDCAGYFENVSYGNNSNFEEDDVDYFDVVNWEGGFLLNTGHFIEFSITLPKKYPDTCPVLQFSKAYKDFDCSLCEDEMKYYVKAIRSYTDKDLKLKIDKFQDKFLWTKDMFVGEWLQTIKKAMFR